MCNRVGLVVLLALSFAVPPPAPGADARSVALVVTDEQGAFVPDVRPEEVRLFENGEPREISSFTKDDRPLAVALILDASDGGLVVFRVHAPGATLAFLAGLPAGARVTLWTTGERSRKVGDLKGEAEEVEKKVAQGFGVGGTNALLEALVDAADSLGRESGQRRAIVAVSGQWSGHTTWAPGDVSSRVRKAAARVFGVMYREGEASPVGSLMGLDRPRDVQNLTVVGPADHERILIGLAQATGGHFESVGTGLAVSHQLERFAAELGGQYRVRFTVRDVKGPRRIEARVLRPGVHSRVVVDSP
jgi:VWFA-related protein